MAERFSVRGAYLEETIQLWRHLWSGSSEPFHGRFHDVSDFVFGPLPAQRSSLPIWIGGRNEAALARAGRLLIPSPLPFAVTPAKAGVQLLPIFG